MSHAATRLDGAITLGAAARSEGLSPGRARHLFVEQTGVLFRTYPALAAHHPGLWRFFAGGAVPHPGGA